MILKRGRQLLFVYMDEIDWIGAAANYLQVHAGGEVHTVRETMKNLEARLDARFIRVHRSALVNAERIRSISSDNDGESAVVLKDGTRIRAGRYLEAPLREWTNSAC